MYQWIIMCEVLCWNNIKDIRKIGQRYVEIRDRFVNDTE